MNGRPDEASSGSEIVAGRYRVAHEIARGGMGAVLQVVDLGNGREVAMKQLLDVGNDVAVSLFEREYATLAGIDHPRIIRVFEYGIAEGTPYYTMEILEGSDLRTKSRSSYREACRYLRDIATSLALLHARGLVHRDVTPRNVFLGHDGRCKLFDFGALAPFGPIEHVVGTPPFVAPEVVTEMRVDRGTDLFALGALGYWLLTGRHAFPSRSFGQVLTANAVRPPPPSTFAEDVPDVVDALILALLQRDPLARPSSAAEVVDRLDRIIGRVAEVAETRREAYSYFDSARIVARDRELAVVENAIREATTSSGAAFVLRGPSGVGRSGLLREMSTTAELRGAVVVRVRAAASRKPASTVVALARRTIEVFPRAGIEALGAARDLLVLLDPALEKALPREKDAPGFAPSVSRELAREILVDYWRRLSTTSPLVLAVDDAEDADDASLAILAALAEAAVDARIVLLVAVRADGPTTNAAGLEAIFDRSRVLDIAPLEREDVDTLLGALFGQTPGRKRCAEWLREATAGMPLHLLLLARLLVERGEIRFHESAWILPVERPDVTMSKALGELLVGHLGGLSAEAHHLAEILALLRGSIRRDACATLTGTAFPSPIDELLAARILRETGSVLTFTHQAMREAIVREMSVSSQNARHRELASYLRDSEPKDAFTYLEIARHLMDGGQLEEGAEWVRPALAIERFDELKDALHDVAPIVARAVEVFREHGRSEYVLAPALAMLADAGYYDDWRWIDRAGDEALDTLERVVGLRDARRWSRFLGRFVALPIALMVAAIRFAFARRNGADYPFRDLFTYLVRTVTSLAGASAVRTDLAMIARASAVLAPFTTLGRRATLVGAYDYARHFELCVTERPLEVVERYSEIDARLGDPSYYTDLPEASRVLLRGGAWFVLGAWDGFFRGDRTLAFAEKLESTGFALHRMQAHQLRVIHHAYRGEIAIAERHVRDVDLYAIEVGSAWQAESWGQAVMLFAHTAAADVVALRRIVENLGRIADENPLYRRFERVARGALAMARKEWEEAIEHYSAVTDELAERSFIGHTHAIATSARAHRMLGRHGEALALVRRAFKSISEDDRRAVMVYVWLEIEEAMALTMLGDALTGARLLDAILASGRIGDNPMVLGMIHLARAQNASVVGDPTAFCANRDAAIARFTATGTPSLIAQLDAIRQIEVARDDASVRASGVGSDVAQDAIEGFDTTETK